MESGITEEGINYLKSVLPSVNLLLSKAKPISEFPDSSYTFGSLQSPYNKLKNYSLEYSSWLNNETKLDQIHLLNTKIQDNGKLKKIYQQQYEIAEKELENIKSNFIKEKQLFQKGLISEAKFNTEENILLNKKYELKNIEKQLSQINLSISDLKESLIIIKNNVKQKRQQFKRNIELATGEIRTFINNWEETYLFQSPINGKLVYLDNLSKNQYIKNGKKLFAVIPQNKNYIGIMHVSAQGFGKIQIDQKVRIQLKNFPHQEYGKLMGKVTKVSSIPNEGQYRLRIHLPDTLITNYGKSIKYKPQMSGIAAVITEDYRLIQRFIFRLKDKISR